MLLLSRKMREHLKEEETEQVDLLSEGVPLYLIQLFVHKRDDCRGNM